MKIYNKINILIFLLLLVNIELIGQEEDRIGYNETFGAVRIGGISHSIESPLKGTLNFDIQHQFGPINSGIQDFFGLDQAITRLGLGYSITDWLYLGFARTGYQKTYDGSMKIRFLHQAKSGGMPISATYFANVAVNTSPWNTPEIQYYLSHRFSYVHQLMLARKMNKHFSLQLSPTYIHKNFAETSGSPNDIFSVGMAAAYHFTQRLSLSFDYHWVLTKHYADLQNNTLTIGFGFLTAGHVFQLYATNANGLLEQQFIPGSEGKWSQGDIHFGFCIVRSFTLIEPDYF